MDRQLKQGLQYRIPPLDAARSHRLGDGIAVFAATFPSLPTSPAGQRRSAGFYYPAVLPHLNPMEQCRRALTRQIPNGTVAKEMGANRTLVWRVNG